MDELSKRSLWMGSLEPQMNEEVLLTAFAKMGETVKVKFVRDKVTRALITTYCFIEFEDQEHAERALKNISGKPLPNFPHAMFHLAPSRSGSDSSQGGVSRTSADSLFVGGLSEDVEEGTLYDFFKSRYPTVKEAKLCMAPDGTSKGFGFVRFFNESDRLEALRRMNGVRGLGSKQIFVSPATPKPSYSPRERQARFAANTHAWHHQDTDGYYSQQHLPGQYPQTTPQQHPYYSSDSWNGQSYQQYPSHYPSQSYDYSSQQNSYQASHQHSSATQSLQVSEERKEDDELADQELHFDVDKMNEEFIQNNEDLYSSLEKSRWTFVPSLTATLDEISMT